MQRRCMLKRPIIAGVACLFAALVFYFCGATSTRWGNSIKLNETRLVQGGLGGILAGYATSTAVIFLPFVLLQTPPKLSSVAFYAIFAFGSIPLALVAGRFKWVGRVCLALTGAMALTANLILSAHPVTLLPRLVLLAIIVVLSLVSVVVLPLVSPSLYPKLASPSIELISSKKYVWVDAVGLFANEDIRLGVEEEWGQTKSFKGLLAGSWLLGVVAAGWQFWRWREVGDDPDEQWNSYLGKLINHEKDKQFKAGRSPVKRKGVFVPEPTFWDKLFGRSRGLENVRPASPLFDDEKVDSPLTDLPEKKKHTREKERDLPWEETDEEKSRSPQRYDPHDADITDDIDDDQKTLAGSIDFDFKRKEFDKLDEKMGLGIKLGDERAPIPRKQSTATALTSLSGSTAVGSDHHYSQKQEECSDSSSSESEGEPVGDLEAGNMTRQKKKGMVSSISKMFGGQSRKPARYSGVHSSDRSRSLSIDATPISPSASRPRPVSRQSQHRPVSRTSRPASFSNSSKQASSPSTSPKAPATNLVPATPSLLRAIDRIQEAQRQARGELSAVTEVTEPVSEAKGRKNEDLWAQLEKVSNRREGKEI
ncbi:hypothetical protein BT69DRAFT_193737 [Atractiella rhizophila]|nr:hypothetical protein BT69DRAFT_193737 [Atractiella rhizophila]